MIVKKIVAALALIGICSSANALSVNDTVTGHATVYRVIDGDTFILNIEDTQVYRDLRSRTNAQQREYLNDRWQSFRVRLAAVDTPESVHPDETKNTLEGKVISEIVKNRLEGQRVTFKCWDFGYYGRAICHITHQGQDIGKWLIQKGYAEYETRFGNDPFHHQKYRRAQQ